MTAFRPLLLSIVLAATSCTASEPSYQGPPAIGDAGSTARGLTFAQEACASCHAVARSDAMSPHPDAPPFAVIVRMPGMNGMALNVWLHSEHEQMPHLIIDENNVDDLWAYMSTLPTQE